MILFYIQSISYKLFLNHHGILQFFENMNFSSLVVVIIVTACSIESLSDDLGRLAATS